MIGSVHFIKSRKLSFLQRLFFNKKKIRIYLERISNLLNVIKGDAAFVSFYCTDIRTMKPAFFSKRFL